MSHTFKPYALTLLGALAVTACSGESGDSSFEGKSPSSLVPYALKQAASCTDVWRLMKDRALHQMQETLAANERDLLDRKANEELCWVYDEAVGAAGTDAGSEDNSGSSASSYSTTNNQVAEVDEADFIENDGKYIYMLAGGKLNIIEAWPAETAHQIGSVDIVGEPKKLFVANDHAVVYSSLEVLGASDPNFDSCLMSPTGECTYGYDCDFTGDGRRLKVTVLDIADKTQPKLVRETDFDGAFLNARRIDDTVYTAVAFPALDELSNLLQTLPLVPQSIEQYQWQCGADVKASSWQIHSAYAALLAENLQKIEATAIKGQLPAVTDTRYVNGDKVVTSGLLEGCQGFYISQAGDGMNLISLVGQDVSGADDLELTTVVGRPGAIYANASALYLGMRHYQAQSVGWYYSGPDNVEEATTFHKFVLEPKTRRSAYAASGLVKGRILNQFAMDEYEGHLRAATTIGHLPDVNAYNTVSVLAEQDGELKLIGQVDHVAPAEDIRSVRFNGDVGYVVTFKKTDPLFVLDLKNPKAPAIKGELKIPGFSTYMHILDATHLLTIGYNADDMGDFAWFNGLQLQIIDVSDIENPKLTYKELIGTRGSSSEAATNHLAFNYFRDKGLLALPVTVCEGGGDGEFGYEMSFSGLLVYSVSTETGFTKLGGVPHAAPTTGDDYATVCGSWWSDSSSAVLRSVFMEDYVYSVAPELIKVAKVSDLANPVASIPLSHKDYSYDSGQCYGEY